MARRVVESRHALRIRPDQAVLQARAPGRATLGIGDDCALLTPAARRPAGDLVRHAGRRPPFLCRRRPAHAGPQGLAVNLSDLAAMGAKPVAFTLALALPQADPDWLAGFSRGLFELADEFGCELIGGDTTKGPLNICITVFGELAPGQALRRDAALAGDDIWVSGTLGDARLALAGLRDECRSTRRACSRPALRMHMPTPRVALGRALAAPAWRTRRWIFRMDWWATSATSWPPRRSAPRSMPTRCRPARCWRAQERALRRRFCAAGGDDYELCFTAPPATARRDRRSGGAAAARRSPGSASIDAAPGLRLVDAGAPHAGAGRLRPLLPADRARRVGRGGHAKVHLS